MNLILQYLLKIFVFYMEMAYIFFLSFVGFLRLSLFVPLHPPCIFGSVVSQLRDWSKVIMSNKQLVVIVVLFIFYFRLSNFL